MKWVRANKPTRRTLSAHRVRYMTDVFADAEGFTTAGSAIAILLACTLAFFCLWSARAQSQAAGVQALCDAAALAAENEVAEFVLSVRVADATLLSMSLTGLAALAVGTVCCSVPAAAATGLKLIDTGRAILEKRDDMARATQTSLNAAQDSLPLLAQTQAQMVLTENAEEISGTGLGYVELVPADAPEVNVGFSEAAQDAAAKATDSGSRIAEAAQSAEQAAQEAADARIRAWKYDCGNVPLACMAERAEALSGITAEENPIAHTVDTWSFEDALNRARIYYSYRASEEEPASDSVEEQVRSAMRSKFYEYAIEELAEGRAYDDGTTQPDLYFPEFFSNTSGMRETRLYSEKAYPVSGGALHAYEGCPGIEGASEGLGSLKELEAGTYEKCSVCQFDAVSLGKVAAASTSIDNGFEHHYREVARAARDYAEAQAQALPAAQEVKDLVEESLDTIMEAFEEVLGQRVEAYPPGRFGTLVAYVFDTEERTADSSFFSGADTGSFAAISSAILVEDEGENALALLLDGVEEDIGPPLSDAGSAVLGIWGSLVEAYGSGVDGLVDGVQELLESIPLASASGLGPWAAGTLMDALESLGLEPANTASPKPVVVNSKHVAERGDGLVAQAVLALKGETAFRRSQLIVRTRTAALERSRIHTSQRRLCGQMTVEAAVVLPVMAAMAFVLVNVLVFVGDCTAFDIVARDAIRLQADDGYESAEGAAEVRARIEEGLSMDHEEVTVVCERTVTGHVRYTAKTAFTPPFLRGVSVFGMSAPALEHEVSMTVSPYRKGVAV